jgi:hypothetical protein
MKLMSSTNDGPNRRYVVETTSTEAALQLGAQISNALRQTGLLVRVSTKSSTVTIVVTNANLAKYYMTRVGLGMLKELAALLPDQ